MLKYSYWLDLFYYYLFHSEWARYILYKGGGYQYDLLGLDLSYGYWGTVNGWVESFCQVSYALHLSLKFWFTDILVSHYEYIMLI